MHMCGMTGTYLRSASLHKRRIRELRKLPRPLKPVRKIRKQPSALKPLERVKAITGIAHERNTQHAFTVALRGEVGGTVNDVLVLDVAGTPVSLSYSTLMQQNGMPCKHVTGAQALVANCVYVAIQVAFVLFSMDHRVWYTSKAPPPLFVDAVQEVLDKRGWETLKHAKVA